MPRPAVSSDTRLGWDHLLSGDLLRRPSIAYGQCTLPSSRCKQQGQMRLFPEEKSTVNCRRLLLLGVSKVSPNFKSNQVDY
eukprot:3401199-Pyramimonas_sp.AAC.2